MKVDFKKIDKDSKKVVPGQDPYQDQGGWFNVPFDEKGYTIIHEFIPICGDLGRVSYNEDMGDDCFAVEIFCGAVFSEVILCDSYGEVCEVLSVIQISVIEGSAT
jgi:hypothetical protein